VGTGFGKNIMLQEEVADVYFVARFCGNLTLQHPPARKKVNIPMYTAWMLDCSGSFVLGEFDRPKVLLEEIERSLELQKQALRKECVVTGFPLVCHQCPLSSNNPSTLGHVPPRLGMLAFRDHAVASM
jgi:hypothetical protein